ncbi:10073_t:CDS:2, partial [Gigaspora rosea]
MRAELRILKERIKRKQLKSRPNRPTNVLHFNPKMRRQQELILDAIKEEEVQKELMEIMEKTKQLKQKVYKVNIEVIEKRVDEIIPKSKQVVIEINQRMAGAIEKQRVKELIKGVSCLLGKVKPWTSWATIYTISKRKEIQWSVTYKENMESMTRQMDNTRVFDIQHDR